MTVRVAADDAGSALIRIGGELDLSTIEQLERAAGAALDRRPKRLTVDVAGLRFADSSAIALWVRWASTVEKFELRDPPAFLRRVIGAMGLAAKLGLER